MFISPWSVYDSELQRLYVDRGHTILKNINMGTYYNNAISNDVHSRCLEFGCRDISLLEIENLLTYLSYLHKMAEVIEVYCSDGNFRFSGGKRRQYMAAIFLKHAMPYREKTINEIEQFIKSI